MQKPGRSKMKFKLLVSTMIAAGVIAMPSLATGGAADLSSCCAPGDKDYPEPRRQPGQPGLFVADADQPGRTSRSWGRYGERTSRPCRRPRRSRRPAPHAGQQTTPIVVDGVIYLDTPSGGVIAVDGATGATKWKWHADRVRHQRHAPRRRRSVKARSTRSPTAIASSRWTRTPARRSGSCSRRGPRRRVSRQHR